MSHTVSQASHNGRLDAVRAIVKQHLGREADSILPLGRNSNNFVHLVSLTETTNYQDHHGQPSAPGTKVVPSWIRKVVVRLSNPDANLDNAVRVENEVAALTLMQAALSNLPAKIVPDVYAWNTAAAGDGWIVQQYMEGEQLSESFPKLSDDQKQSTLDQIARVLKLIQDFRPEVAKFGGLNFDADGKVVSGGLTLWTGGPFDKYTELYTHVFHKQLHLSKTTALLNGWDGTGLPERLQAFAQSGKLDSLLDEYAESRQTLVHGDISLENILFDPKSLQITALLDFDFAHVATANEEFFYSFVDFHGIVPGPFEGPEMERLRLAQLSGFRNESVGSPGYADGLDWNVARMWQTAMEKAQARCPADLQNIGELAAIYWFMLDVCPPYFLLPSWLAKRNEQQHIAAKESVVESLDRYLSRWGH